MYSHFIPGDQRLNMEGNFYGLYMFEANHQCVISKTIFQEEVEPVKSVDESVKARNRCDPYVVWFRANDKCKKDSAIDRIEVQIDHSINGEPFYRIVDVPSICAVDYKGLSKNAWIKTSETGALKIGYPMRNYYY